jgi:carbonic anhydrase
MEVVRLPRVRTVIAIAAALTMTAAACAGQRPPEPPTAVEPPGREALAEAHWAYQGEEGPQHWGSLSPEFATCESGRAQSPVDLTAPDDVDLADLEFGYGSSTLKIIDNGHTIRADVQPGNTLTIDGTRFELAQFHFHAPSEHTIDGASSPMELHLVHLGPNGAIAVVAVMIVEGARHAALAAVWDNLPAGRDAPAAAPRPVDLNDLLPTNRDDYRYAGSLTTPPCTEGVAWNILVTPIAMSTDQIAAFTARYPADNRPLEPLNGRHVVLDRAS